MKDSQSHLAEKSKTYHAKENSYRSFNGEKNPREKTMDYVMFFNSKVLNVTRPLASAKIEGTGKSYSVHEALEVDFELSITSDDKKSNTASESKGRTHEGSLKSSKIRALKSEIVNTLEKEVNKAFWWGNFHLCCLFLALALAFTFILSLRIFIVGFALFFCAFQLGMHYIYLERHSSLKAILQDFGFQEQSKLA